MVSKEDADEMFSKIVLEKAIKSQQNSLKTLENKEKKLREELEEIKEKKKPILKRIEEAQVVIKNLKSLEAV